MRVIAGYWKGKKLIAPKGDIVKPTTDRAKEALFSILESYFMKNNLSWNELSFLDVFSGSGSIGIEALSRGAKYAAFIDVHPQSLTALKTNLPSVNNIKIIKANALNLPKGHIFDIVFMDPPYNKNLPEKTLVQLMQKNWINSSSLIIIEMDVKEEYSFNGFNTEQVRTYHRNKFVFLKPTN